MKISQVKDAMAAAMFAAAMVVVWSGPVPRELVLKGLGLGVTVDTLFTLNSKWHEGEWKTGPVLAKLVVVGQVFVFAYIIAPHGSLHLAFPGYLGVSWTWLFRARLPQRV